MTSKVALGGIPFLLVHCCLWGFGCGVGQIASTVASTEMALGDGSISSSDESDNESNFSDDGSIWDSEIGRSDLRDLAIADPGDDGNVGWDEFGTDVGLPDIQVSSQQPQPPVLFTASDGSKNYLRTPLPLNRINHPDSNKIMENFPMTGQYIPRLNLYDWSFPTYNGGLNDPSYSPRLTYANEWGCSVGDSIRIPDLAASSPGGYPGSSWDGWLIVVDLPSGMVKSIWRADKSDGIWKGDCGGVFPIEGNGFKKAIGVGIGSGASAAAGLITLDEIKTGRIEHALYAVSNSLKSGEYVEPATKTDASGNNGAHLVEGQRLYLDLSVDCDGLTGASIGEKLICKALQEYGAYILDQTGCCGSGVPYWGGFAFQGDDLTDPERSPWNRPGDGTRPGGVYDNIGLSGAATDLSHIPWFGNVHVCKQWDCK